MDPFEESLSPDAGVAYRLSRAVARAFPGMAVVDGLDQSFDVEELAEGGRCAVMVRPSVHASFATEWTRAHGLASRVVCSVLDVDRGDESFVVVTASWPEAWSRHHVRFLVGATEASARAFAAEVHAYCNEVRRAVLTFSSGCWSKSHDLWETIQAASYDDLVLASSMKETIRDDLTLFVEGKAEYERLGVPWKRGILLVGPPGNGKTHCLRATIKHLGLPCLYVQSLRSRYDTDDQNIGKVFSRAREISPCVLVFEDLDAMITDENRSLFLNQIDGFSGSSGMITLATTNHVDRLDPAITERPSRFDRKYHFDLPAAPERQAYVELWNRRLGAEMRLPEDALGLLVDDTAGFSFAYLKELFVSGMVRWMRDRRPGTMLGILRGELGTLRQQMTTELSAPPPKPKGESD